MRYTRTHFSFSQENLIRPEMSAQFQKYFDLKESLKNFILFSTYLKFWPHHYVYSFIIITFVCNIKFVNRSFSLNLSYRSQLSKSQGHPGRLVFVLILGESLVVVASSIPVTEYALHKNERIWWAIYWFPIWLTAVMWDR